jgi:3-deoxy-D-manno-octulosonic-acid transferase
MIAKPPFALRVYGLMTRLLAGFLPGVLRRRAVKGKEDPARLQERLARAPIARPTGVLVWLHGASVGETMVALAVAQRLREARPEVSFLFTSGTKTSADMIASRLQGSDVHRYLPVDTPAATRAFIEGWAPDLGVFVEGEIWPNLLMATRAAGIKTALINARMTAKSSANWTRRRAAARYLFDGFDLVLPADTRTQTSLTLLRDGPIGAVGNLKLAAPPPHVDLDLLQELRDAIAGRPVWLAASTHQGEDKTMIMVHNAIMTAAPDALLILAPRHPERANDVEVDCRLAGIVPVRRSKGDVPNQNDPIWLWDTLGELGLAISLAPVTFMGGSIVDGVGGHNPVEPAQVGSAIVSGALVHNFENLYQDLEDAGGARIIDNPMSDVIAMAVAGLMGDAETRAKEVAAARSVVARGAGAMDVTVAGLLGLLP